MTAKPRIPLTGDLFPGWTPPSPRPRRRGHAATPGSGPEGETCGSCAHLARKRRAKTYLKCGLVKWTSGAGTDVRAKDPACSWWEGRGDG